MRNESEGKVAKKSQECAKDSAHLDQAREGVVATLDELL